MLVHKFRVDAARSRAAEARRYVEQTRALIDRLRSSGREVGSAEAQLQAILPIVEKFEDHVQWMEEALRGESPGARLHVRPSVLPHVAHASSGAGKSMGER